jgi:hypothetical protein
MKSSLPGDDKDNFLLFSPSTSLQEAKLIQVDTIVRINTSCLSLANFKLWFSTRKHSFTEGFNSEVDSDWNPLYYLQLLYSLPVVHNWKTLLKPT